MKENLPEPWLRGPMAGVDPLLAPALYSLQAAREDLAEVTDGLAPEQIWSRPNGITPLGFHLRHIAGSVDRLTTYLQGKQLSEPQVAESRTETEPRRDSREQLLATIEQSFRKAEQTIRSIDPRSFTEARTIGRKQLPTTVIGLIVHIAEHTQRHVGEAVVAAKVARGYPRAQLERAVVRDRDLDREVSADWSAVDAKSPEPPTKRTTRAGGK